MNEENNLKGTEKELLDKDKLLEEVEAKLKSLPVSELVSVMATDLASVGFRKLGLIDGENQDLEGAKIAIDSLEALYGVISNHLGDKEKEILKMALSNLKMEYVKKVG